MKHETWETPVVGGVLAWIIAFASVSCLDTGFDLRADIVGIALGILAWSGVCGLCFSFRRGRIVLLCLIGLAAGYVWYSGDLADQLPGLLYEITQHYDNGYGIGVMGRPGRDMEVPLLCMGAVIALAVCYAVCCRTSAAWAVVAALFPLALCLVVIDTVPDETCLYWLIFGVILLVMTNHLRRNDPRQGNGLTYLLAAPLALALGLLFLLVPQKGYDRQPRQIQAMILGWIQDMPDSLGELGEELASTVDGNVRAEEVDLTLVGPQRQFTYPVLDVVAPRSGTLYLREQDYDCYDGTGWSSTEQRDDDFGITDGLHWREVGTVTVATRRSRDLLLLPYYPGDAVDLSDGHAENGENASAYTWRYYVLPDDWHSTATGTTGNAVHADGNLYDFGNRRYLTVPGDSREELEFLLSGILTDEVSATEKAEAIAAYVRGSARYDLDTQRMPGDESDFALWFLNDSQTGYCVHFATATAVLLRAAGVESRYVTGYMISVRAGEVATVTQAQAHAWVEYYEPRLGVWLVLESTPADLHGEEPETTQTEKPEETTQSTLPEDTQVPETEDRGVASVGDADASETENAGENRWIKPLLQVLLILAAVLAVPLQWQLRLALRRRKRAGADINERVLYLWQDAEHFAAALGWTPPRELEALAQKAKFSQHTLTETELRDFTEYLAEAEENCREKPFWRQLYWRLVLALY